LSWVTGVERKKRQRVEECPVGSRETDLDREIERYRVAMALALEQLEWAEGYLHQIRKPGLARAVERNRKKIVQSLRGRA